MKNELGIELKVEPMKVTRRCSDAKCEGTTLSLFIASKGEDVRIYNACDRLNPNVKSKVLSALAKKDYMVAEYRCLK